MLAFPNKKYQIIYADPPWDVSLFSRIVRPTQKPHPYPKMSLKNIKELPIKSITNENGCHLFMWTTHKWLPKAFEVMESWGFKYHCCLTWDKTFGFTPYSFMWSTEFCLYGQIPKKWKRPVKMGIKTLITEKPTKHSKKPSIMRNLIIDFCGDLSRIELFARPPKDLLFEDESYKGWDLWGNEV
ncbi:MAG: MT-A70 family methyltransferase [Candidatus Heimdallarchaeaceae archaeon]